MTKQQIDRIVSHRAVPQKERVIETIETFISWVVICERFTYKIKRPVHFSFLDFSSIQRRKNFCLQEYYLNRQLAGDMYMDVLPITDNGDLKIGGNGDVIDYAVKMRTIDNSRLMNAMLLKGLVTEQHVEDLADTIADFHSGTRLIYNHANFNLMPKFNDLAGQTAFLSNYMSLNVIERMHESVTTFRLLFNKFTPRIMERVKLGFFRDCHGDLHSGNVFLMEKPIPFDRIEFDPELREIDVLNEVAFMCMDLEYFGRPDLSQLFFEKYNLLFPTVLTKEDEELFLLYKAYRANVCAKVNSLKAQSAFDPGHKQNYIKKGSRYLVAMNKYHDRVQRSVLGAVHTEMLFT